MPLGTRTLLKTTFDSSKASDRSSKLSAFLSEENLGNLLTFTSFSFNEIEDEHEAQRKRRVLAAILTPCLVILVGAIVAFVLYFREQKNLEQKQKETQLAVKA